MKQIRLLKIYLGAVTALFVVILVLIVATVLPVWLLLTELGLASGMYNVKHRIDTLERRAS